MIDLPSEKKGKRASPLSREPSLDRISHDEPMVFHTPTTKRLPSTSQPEMGRQWFGGCTGSPMRPGMGSSQSSSLIGPNRLLTSSEEGFWLGSQSSLTSSGSKERLGKRKREDEEGRDRTQRKLGMDNVLDDEEEIVHESKHCVKWNKAKELTSVNREHGCMCREADLFLLY